jgi:hypothetical protein
LAQATNVSIISPSRFHNLADPALADALGHAESVLKGAEAECKLLKDEFKHRGLVEVAGDQSTVTATEQIAARYQGREGISRRILSPLRKRGHRDRYPHQGGAADRKRGIA